MKKILVTTDYSANALNALDYACNLAKEFNAEVTILHIFNIWIPVNEVPAIMPPVQELESENKKNLEKLTETYSVKYDLKIGFHLSSGALIPVLEEYIKANGIDLLVMGMRGGGEMSKHLLGSNTTAVLKEGFCPVIVVPEKCEFTPPVNYAFAADLQKSNEGSFSILKEFLRHFKAKLQIFNVVEYKQKVPDLKQAIEGISIDHIFEGFERDYYFPESNNIIHGIELFLYHHKPDVLVMIPRKHNFLFNMFREGHTERVVYTAKIPVLVLPGK